MLFQEVTASNLIVCDLEGKVVRGRGELRKVAFHIHARIHLRNPLRINHHLAILQCQCGHHDLP